MEQIEPGARRDGTPTGRHCLPEGAQEESWKVAGTRMAPTAFVGSQPSCHNGRRGDGTRFAPRSGSNGSHV
jgi:hypothetical protein